MENHAAITCKKCQASIPAGYAFCPYCGKAMEPQTRRKRRRANGEGNVYKRGGTYTLRVTLGYELCDGKSRAIVATKGGFATQREAIAYIPTLKAEGRPDTHRTAHAQDYSKITFAELYEKLIDRHAQRVGKSTLNCYKAAYKYFSDVYALPFAELNTEDWQLCIDDCPQGLRTRQNMKALGTLMYKLAAELRVFGLNTQTDFASLVWLKGESESRKPFAQEELESIKRGAAAGVPFAAWIVAMCYTGFRPSEFLDLRRDAFDPSTWTLRGGAKTDAGKNRIVPVHPLIRPLIAAQAIGGGEYLFADESGKKYTLNHFREVCFYPALEACGVQGPPERTPYSTRHTFATLIKGIDGSTKDKAALMGHTSYEMTMHYQHEDFDSLRRIVEAIS